MTAPDRPTAHTRRAHRDACTDLGFDWENRQDFEFARRGLIHRPDDPAITDADGVAVWHHEAFEDFLRGEMCLHNVYTIRGAFPRDAMQWADSIARSLPPRRSCATGCRQARRTPGACATSPRA